MEYTIYHNPRCTKSRQGLALLQEKGVKTEVREYLKELPTTKELKDLLSKLGMSAEELMRKGEKDYKEQVKEKDLSEDEKIERMIAFPKLIERPIVIKGNKAVVGRPTEKILELF